MVDADLAHVAAGRDRRRGDPAGRAADRERRGGVADRQRSRRRRSGAAATAPSSPSPTAATRRASGWVVEFDLPAGSTVSSSWESTRTSTGQHHRFANASWNGDRRRRRVGPLRVQRGRHGGAGQLHRQRRAVRRRSGPSPSRPRRRHRRRRHRHRRRPPSSSASPLVRRRRRRAGPLWTSRRPAQLQAALRERPARPDDPAGARGLRRFVHRHHPGHRRRADHGHRAAHRRPDQPHQRRQRPVVPHPDARLGPRLRVLARRRALLAPHRASPSPTPRRASSSTTRRT